MRCLRSTERSEQQLAGGQYSTEKVCGGLDRHFHIDEYFTNLPLAEQELPPAQRRRVYHKTGNAFAFRVVQTFDIMKTLIALSTALLLAFTAPAYAGDKPVPVSKNNRHSMMTKRKKHKKPGGKKLFGKRERGKATCDGMVN